MQPHVGEIILVGFNFAPVGWAFCNGQLLAISEFETLFNLIGTTYGGDGQTTFAVPDLRGRAPIAIGQGPGLSNRILGESGGNETVTLLATQMPQHAHSIDTSGLTATARCKNGPGNQRTPIGNVPAIEASAVTATYSNAAPNADMNPGALVVGGNMTAATTGGNQPHSNLQPYLTLNYCISLFGIFPSQ